MISFYSRSGTLGVKIYPQVTRGKGREGKGGKGVKTRTNSRLIPVSSSSTERLYACAAMALSEVLSEAP